jgi:hypothetical protein
MDSESRCPILGIFDTQGHKKTFKTYTAVPENIDKAAAFPSHFVSRIQVFSSREKRCQLEAVAVA